MEETNHLINKPPMSDTNSNGTKSLSGSPSTDAENKQE